MTLKEFFINNPKVAIGFSGGVDSAYLLYAAVQQGADVRPYFIRTAFQPEFELEDARRLTEKLGVKLTVIDYDILRHETVTENPANRCYYCKTALFGILKEQAGKDGYSLLIDGTNASDDAADRPGTKALQEMEVRSPLRECGLTKDEIRRLSREAGLFTWEKPAYACLATRIPAGKRLTKELLYKVEQAENQMFQMGFQDFRIRVFHDAARIQLPMNQMEVLFQKREELLEALKPWFDIVLLDLKGR